MPSMVPKEILSIVEGGINKVSMEEITLLQAEGEEIASRGSE